MGGLNIVKRHERPRRSRPPKSPQLGGMVEKEGPIHVSNVMLLDPKDNKRPGSGFAGQRRRAEALRNAVERRLMEATDRANPGRPPPRLRDRYEQDVVRADQQVRLLDADAGTAPDQDHAQHGRRRGQAGREKLEAAQKQLATIAGQQPGVRRARKSIASFKVREGMPVGLSVTLRRARMWEFLDRLCSIAVPRIRDFRGLDPRSFDGRGNYSMGVKGS